MTMLNSLFYLTLVFTFLLLSSCAQGDELDPAPDPYCLRGLCGGRACCPLACGKCGGKGCRKRIKSLGRKCCTGHVKKKLGRNCNKEGPPCKVQKPKKCQKPPTTTSPMSLFTTPRWTGPGTWTNIDAQVRGKPTARHENCFVMVNGKGYLIGGRGTRPVEEFNPLTRRWEEVAEMPTQMHHMQCVAYKNAVYIVAAWYGRSPSESNVEKLWIFHTDTYKWESRTGLPAERRRGGAAQVLFDDRIYVLCGNRGGHGPPSKSLGWVDYYDLKNDMWVTGLSSIPSGHERDHVGGARVGDKICIAGGRNGGMENPFRATVESTFCYDPNKDEWENMMANIPAPRAGSATGRSCDGRLMVVGGEGRFSPAFDQVDLFDGKKWETVRPLVRSRHGTGLAIADCRYCEHVFIAAGSGRRGGSPELDSTEVYIPEGRSMTCTKY